MEKQYFCQSEAEVMKKYKRTKTFLPLRVEIHQLGHIITDTSFQYNTVFIGISVKERQKTKKED